MAVTVAKATVIENVYKNFYDLVNAIGALASKVYPEFHENHKFDNKADYPTIILNSPEISWEGFTFGRNVLTGTIDLDVYTTTAKDADQYASDIHNQIEVSKHTLAQQGLREVNLESTNKDNVQHGEIRIHLKTLTFTFKFYFARTGAY